MESFNLTHNYKEECYSRTISLFEMQDNVEDMSIKTTKHVRYASTLPEQLKSKDI
jgi:hypothetical protein